MKFRLAAAVFVFIASVSLAQSANQADKPAEQRGFTASIGFEGSLDSSSHVFDLGSSAGYKFNKHFQLDFGVPYYFLSSPTSGTTSGLGNAALAMRFLFPNPVVNYATSITGSIPTGDPAKGLSTGRGTFDWTNHFDREIGHVTPRLDIGVANTIVDSRLFMRPFSSLGFNAHAEAGASIDLFSSLSFEASVYDIQPAGQQKIYSRTVRGSAAGNPNPQHGRAWEGGHLVVGGASLTQDDGFSAALDLSPAPCVDMYGGYTRSVKYALDSVSFGIGLNIGQAMHPRGCHKQ